MNTDSPDNDTIVDASLVSSPPPAARKLLWLEWSYHLSLLATAVGILTMSFLMRLEGSEWVFLPGTVLPLPDACWSRKWLGLDCPGCGLTRSFICISRGDFGSAASFNFAGPLAYLFAIVQIPWQLFQLRNLATGRLPFYAVWLFVPPGIVLVALLLQWVIKLL